MILEEFQEKKEINNRHLGLIPAQNRFYGLEQFVNFNQISKVVIEEILSFTFCTKKKSKKMFY